MKFIYNLLTDFKFARKKLGGKWYRVRELDAGGLASGIEHWTNTLYDDVIILKEEDYTIPNN